ncbi:MAG: hypothetical protein ABSA76_10105 [Bacteroidales bacterium]
MNYNIFIIDLMPGQNRLYLIFLADDNTAIAFTSICLINKLIPLKLKIMKQFKHILIIATVALFLMSTYTAIAQQKPAQSKVRSVTVYDEKFDKRVYEKSKLSESTYDTHGNIIEEIDYVNNKVDKHFQYQYDASDNQIREIELDSSGKITKTTEYKYDRGLKVEKTVSGADGKVKSKQTYIYTTF